MVAGAPGTLPGVLFPPEEQPCIKKNELMIPKAENCAMCAPQRVIGLPPLVCASQVYALEIERARSQRQRFQGYRRTSESPADCVSPPACPYQAAPRGSHGCARGSHLLIRWRGTRSTRQICRAVGRRQRKLAASVVGARLRSSLPVAMRFETTMRARRVGGPEIPSASSCEIERAPAQRFRCRVVWERASYERA